MAGNEQGIHALWYTEGGGQGIYYAYAEKMGSSFMPREQISSGGRHPQLSAYDNNACLVWEENFSFSNTTSSRIHFQLRNNMNISGDFLTSEKVNAYLPVIIQGKNRFIVAFLLEDAEGTGVYITNI